MTPLAAIGPLDDTPLPEAPGLPQALLEWALTEAGLPVVAADATAAAVQRASLPVLGDLPDLDIAATYIPAGRSRLVGGDWYDAHIVDRDTIVFGIGDACGHGLVAAGLMAQARNALRGLAFHGVTPAPALGTVSRMLAVTHQDDFATCIQARFDRRTRRLTWACAGHPPMLHLDGDGSSFLAGAPGPPLGAFPDSDYAEYDIVLDVDDTLVLYTDGLVEHVGEPIDEGMDRLRAIAERGAASASDLNHLVCERLVGPVPRDDVCVLTVRLRVPRA